MTLVSAFNRPRNPRLEGAVVLFAITLATYFSIVYEFAFSPGTSVSRHGVHAAILLMDVLIAGALVRDRRMLRAALRPHGVHEGLRLLSCLIAFGSLFYVIAQHGDYAMARSRGAEEGWTGSLITLKIHLAAGQLSCLLFLGLARVMPTSVRATLRLFKPAPGDVLLLSVALIPLVNYLVHNRELFSLITAAKYLGFFLLIPLVALAFLQFFQRALNTYPLAAPFAASLAFVYYSMPLVSSALMRPVESLFWVHAGLALIVPATVAGFYLADRRLTSRMLVIGAACSVVGSPLQAGFAGTTGQTRTAAAPVDRQDPAPSALSALLSAPLKRTPDVYLLIYDGFAAGSMMKDYGIEDDSVGGLRRAGFKVYDDAYSIFMASRPSMGSLMDMRATPRAGIGGNNTSTAFFREHGYTTNLILNSYLLQGSASMAADFVYPQWKPESGLNVLYRGIGGGEFKSAIVFQDFDRDEWLAAKRTVLRAPTGGPRTLYAHSGFPGHSQNSGTCQPDEAAQYAARLAVARDEMRADIEAVESSQRDAIIIIAGDHGPYLTGDCLYLARYATSDLTATQLADRYGTTLAIRWPEEVSARIDRIEILQDVFFAVSAYLLDDDRVWMHRVSAETTGYGGIPDGAIKNGTVMVGRDAGRPLFPK